MKILHIDPDDIDNPLSGGGPVRTFEICRRLARRHEITVLTPTFPGSTPLKLRDGVRYVRLGRRIREHGSSHHITFFFSLPGALRRLDYDLVVEDFMPPMAVTFTPLFTRAPLIASVQWFFAESLSRQYRLPFFLGERYGIRLYKNFVVLTDSMKQLILARHPNARCEVLANAVDETLFDVEPRAGDFILYIGRIDVQQKGLDLLLAALARIPEAQRLPLVLAGGGNGLEQVQQLVQLAGLQRWVRFDGMVDAAGRAALLRDCRFVCVPSREETFGMTILEACAAARRVVVFDRPPMNEVAPRHGCLFVPGFDVAAYAGAMQQLIAADATEMLAHGLYCRAWARQYSWDAIAARQERFYESVAAARPDRSGGGR